MRAIAMFVPLMLFSGYANSWYLGTWAVTDVKFPTITAFTDAEAREWFGSEAVYSNAKFSFRDDICHNPEFKTETVTKPDFADHFRATFTDLEIIGETTDILEVSCESLSFFPGRTLIKASEGVSFLVWDGAFFRLDKNN